MSGESTPRDETALLLEFVHERDVACPRCRYNLRNLLSPTCPECEEPLRLHVTAYKSGLGWLLATLAPGGFCAIAVLIFIMLCAVLGPPGWSVDVSVVVGFLVSSGAVALGLAYWHQRFLRSSSATQALWCIKIWIIHVIALAIWIAYIA